MADRFDEIGTLFFRRRKELGLTQEQLGKKVGMTKSEISKIENGRGITFSTINKLSEALRVSTRVELKPTESVSSDVIHYIVMSLGLFARKYKLTKRRLVIICHVSRVLNFQSVIMKQSISSHFRSVWKIWLQSVKEMEVRCHDSISRFKSAYRQPYMPIYGQIRNT